LSPLELIAVFVWSFAVSFFGGLVGLVLGNLRLPLIVLVATSPAAGAGANVAISGAAALTAGYGHWRQGRISWRLFWWMAPTSLIGAIAGGLIGHLPSGIDWAILGVGAAAAMPAAYLGSHFTGRLDERQLIQAMAAVLVVSGGAMAVQAIVG
jgi:uncharacterized membrane protein YfcA